MKRPELQRLLLLVMAVVLCSSSAFAYVHVELAHPSPPYNIERLWRVKLHNDSNVAVTGQLKGEIREDHRVLFWATTTELMLAAGQRRTVRYRNVTVEDSEYYDESLRDFALMNGGLPGGKEYVFKVSWFPNGGSDSVPVKPDPVGPPRLKLPRNQDTLFTLYPSFVWTAARPSPGGGLTYRLKVVKVGRTQGLEEALKANRAIREVHDLVTTSWTYDNAGEELDEGTQYAWQVSYYQHGFPVAGSEVWSFWTPTETLPEPQPTEAYWLHCFGGSEDDFGRAVFPTGDGGCVLAGATCSDDGDVSGRAGSYDAWVAKLDSVGVLQQQKCIGGKAFDEFSDVAQADDGGYVFAGRTSSRDAEVDDDDRFGGGWDMYVVKLDSGGQTIEWARCIGGAGNQEARSVRQTSDGGYVVAGWADVPVDGFAGPGLGSYDGVVMKLSGDGKTQWMRRLGWNVQDKLHAIEVGPGGEALVAGSTDSDSAHGGTDAWVCALSAAGDVQWQVCLGDSGNERAYGLCTTPDGGCMVVGSGGPGVWRLGPGGAPVGRPGSPNNLGGCELYAIRSLDDGYVAGGRMPAGRGRGPDSLPEWDALLIGLDGNGQEVWRREFDGGGNESVTDVQVAADGSLFVTGGADSRKAPFAENHGRRDLWVARLVPPERPE